MASRNVMTVAKAFIVPSAFLLVTPQSRAAAPSSPCSAAQPICMIGAGALTLTDTTSTVDGGGAQRITSFGGTRNTFSWQVNRAAAGDFTAAVNAFTVDGGGNVNMNNHLTQPLTTVAGTSPCNAG